MNASDHHNDGHAPSLEDHFVTRRQFLRRAGLGFGALSFAAMFGDNLFSTASAAEIANILPRSPHFPAKAKHVVHIFAQGAPSHVDTFDPKPTLDKFDGKSLPGMDGVAMASPFKFEKKGKSGIEISEVFRSSANLRTISASCVRATPIFPLTKSRRFS